MAPHRPNIKQNSFFQSLTFRFGASIGSVIFAFTIAIVLATVPAVNNYVNNYAENQAEATADTMAVNYDNYFSRVISVSNYISQTIYNIASSAISSTDLVSELDSIVNVNTDMASVAIYSSDGLSCLAHDSETDVSSRAVTGEDWFLSALKNPTLNVFTTGENDIFKLSKLLSYDKGKSTCVLLVSVSSLANSIYTIDLGEQGHVLIYDKNYNAIYRSLPEPLGAEEIAILQSSVIGYHQATMSDHSFMVSQYTIANTTWRLAIFQNFDEPKTVINRFIWVTTSLALAFMVVSLIVLFFVSKSIISPLKTLRDSMKKVEEQGYLSYESVAVRGASETKDLARNYNEMMARIKTLNDNVLLEQNAQRLSELHALQNQINPHFLYNTLDSIVFLIDENKNKEASDMVVALSRFFRISISKGRNIIPLRDEIEHARNYLIIQKLRYKESFEYAFNVPDSFLDLMVIKLILQPVIENSIQHGLLNRDGIGRIEVNATMENDILVLSVKDNGFGIIPDKVNEIYDSFKNKNAYEGVGLKNVYQRLKIYFGEKADVRIISELDKGTTVSLIIPIKERRINED